MKLCLKGHDQRYVVEQSLLALLPEEALNYEEIDPQHDSDWAIISTREDDQIGRAHV